jgi:predicted RNase H-like HicB family nuclease
MREYFALTFRKPCGGFVVEFPDLPDCVTFANTHEAARAAAAEMLADYIEEMERANQAMPEPSAYDVLRRDPRNIGCDIIRVEAARGAQ